MSEVTACSYIYPTVLKNDYFSTYEYGDEYDAAEPLNIRNNRLINTRPDIILN